MAKKIKYVGKGSFLIGVPGRDMTVEEWEALDEELRELAVSLGLYEVRGSGSNDEESDE